MNSIRKNSIWSILTHFLLIIISSFAIVHYDIENINLLPKVLFQKKTRDDFQIIKKLGSGKFSDVFEAVDVQIVISPSSSSSVFHENYDDVDMQHKVVIKCLKPVNERKIRREIMVLTHVSNLKNVVKLMGVIWEDMLETLEGKDTNRMTRINLPPSLILQHAGEKARWLCHGSGMDSYRTSSSDDSTGLCLDMYLDNEEIKYFLYQLLIALEGLHSEGVIHRDVKPRNVLITRSGKDNKKDQRSLLLVDLGLADFYVPGQKYNVRVASRHYKGPELLVGYEHYDTSLDMWGFGCILAGLLLRREPFFRGRDNIDQLAKISAVLGTPDLFQYCDKYNVTLSAELQKAVGFRQNQRRRWIALCAPGCPTPPAEGLDLLDRLLVYDHAERLTASEAMQHPFFDSVRER